METTHSYKFEKKRSLSTYRPSDRRLSSKKVSINGPLATEGSSGSKIYSQSYADFIKDFFPNKATTQNIQKDTITYDKLENESGSLYKELKASLKGPENHEGSKMDSLFIDRIMRSKEQIKDTLTNKNVKERSKSLGNDLKYNRVDFRKRLLNCQRLSVQPDSLEIEQNTEFIEIDLDYNIKNIEVELEKMKTLKDEKLFKQFKASVGMTLVVQGDAAGTLNPKAPAKSSSPVIGLGRRGKRGSICVNTDLQSFGASQPRSTILPNFGFFKFVKPKFAKIITKHKEVFKLNN